MLVQISFSQDVDIFVVADFFAEVMLNFSTLIFLKMIS